MTFNDQGSLYGNNDQEVAHILFPVLPGRMGFLERGTPVFASPCLIVSPWKAVRPMSSTFSVLEEMGLGALLAE